ncbi:hypothetical protein QCA50_010676 [Cerrena zonata]|uniref:Uncharacterized protein n=1 Tax=Cerrena zonata TaxID=2478898 RepID=A0AAW0G243_9APHY
MFFSLPLFLIYPNMEYHRIRYLDLTLPSSYLEYQISSKPTYISATQLEHVEIRVYWPNVQYFDLSNQGSVQAPTILEILDNTPRLRNLILDSVPVDWNYLQCLPRNLTHFTIVQPRKHPRSRA